MTGSLDVYVENLDQKRMKLMLTWKNYPLHAEDSPIRTEGKEEGISTEAVWRMDRE